MTARNGVGHAPLPGVLAVLAALALGACGPREEPAEGALIARVDGTELRADQLDAELAQRMGAQPGTQDADALRDRAADALVERTLLVNQAVAAGIAADPGVIQAVARAREEVLAAAYLERALDLASGPDQAAVRAHYDAHPELYARRTVFDVRQVTSRGDIEMADVQAAAEAVAGPGELVEWLRARGAEAQLRSTALAPEHLAPALRERLAALAPGQAVLVPGIDQLLINYLIRVRPAPVSFEAARAAIARSLGESVRRERVREEIARLRAQTKIVWLGEFAGRDPERQNPVAAGAKPSGPSVMTAVPAPREGAQAGAPPSPSPAARPGAGR